VRACGGFAVAQYLTRKRLRILCYHGFSLGDEHELIPHMFMRSETFERRLEILRRRRIPVISLDRAIDLFERQGIRRAETVITLDDGWASNLSVGAPLLEKYKFPACIYVTTEHLASHREVFNVVLYYLIVKSGRQTLHLSGIHPALDGEYTIGDDPISMTIKIITAAEKSLDLSARYNALAGIAAALGLNITEVLKNGRFQLLTAEEIADLPARGIAIELHTHSHRLPDNRDGVEQEIELNRRALSAIVGRQPKHFCYPSGLYGSQHPEWLRSLGIASATTCDPGLNTATTSVLLLRRFLDSEVQSAIAFEAEICGLRDLARNAREVFRKAPLAAAKHG
jgi:peptidoglycan/xylan/chitin deacetylase (PgdA/CDA1 family)